ncbi:hypothetical protein IMSHALPRED_010145 [Imshaugia aleurites]|uniref:Uncharacterized protein n=1 Tax=Imshaugia aleurites TaxID=172621 RepID=A0A8H3IVD5_9LECA|nr:hypothetical protein IMSHALPRED_010145 [Imshaugia aleurites]
MLNPGEQRQVERILERVQDMLDEPRPRQPKSQLRTIKADLKRLLKGDPEGVSAGITGTDRGRDGMVGGEEAEVEAGERVTEDEGAGAAVGQEEQKPLETDGNFGLIGPYVARREGRGRSPKFRSNRLRYASPNTPARSWIEETTKAYNKCQREAGLPEMRTPIVKFKFPGAVRGPYPSDTRGEAHDKGGSVPRGDPDDPKMV